MTARADFFCSTKINLKSFNSLQQQPPVSDSLSHSKIGKPVNNGEQSRVWACVCHQTAIAAWYELIKICQINYSTSILVINSSCIYFSNPTGHVKKNLFLPETHITVNCTLKQFFLETLFLLLTKAIKSACFSWAENEHCFSLTDGWCLQIDEFCQQDFSLWWWGH